MSQAFHQSLVAESPSTNSPNRSLKDAAVGRPCLTLCATYTAEPIADFLNFWLHAVGLDWGIEFAGYRQVFQQLLDPNSRLARNRLGYPVLLLRLEDLLPPQLLAAAAGATDDADERAAVAAELQRLVEELTDAIEQFATSRTRALLVAVHRHSLPEVKVEGSVRSLGALLHSASEQLANNLSAVANVVIIKDHELDNYQVERIHDAERSALGDVPFTTEAFAALGTLLARRIHMLEVPARKVLVLDCDNTLWGGVVGEDGVHGIRLDEQHAILQRFAVEQAERGVLVVLCSKNVETDVHRVFEHRSDFELRQEHVVAHRINWLPKSENLVALAQELNLGLESFVFLDDSARECAEVREALPMVLTLQVPSRADALRRMLDHLWAFDKVRVTAEDSKRSELYRQDARRKQAQTSAPNLAAFMDSLQLEVQIEPLRASDVERVAQLTQRTNQFNTTTIRRTEGEVRALLEGPTRCSTVRVSDRFGDYGLVGVAVHEVRRGRLWVDALMLSCRVLGRGVEHAVMRELGGVARRAGVLDIAVAAVATERNEPALAFLKEVGVAQVDGDARTNYSIAITAACTLSAAGPGDESDPNRTEQAISGEHRIELPAEESQPASDKRLHVVEAQGPTSAPRSVEGALLGERVAVQLSSAKAIVDAVAELRCQHAPGSSMVPPKDSTEECVLEIWKRVLNLAELGVEDDFFTFGGNSLLAVSVVAEIQRNFGVVLPLSALLDAPTVRSLGELVSERKQRCLAQLRPGKEDRPAFFFVHDGLGETLLYANLARRLPEGIRVFGLEPQRKPGVPLAHFSIESMAEHYVKTLKSVQSQGPYYLGGLCAGGTIALEVARQLTAAGDRVALVVLFDSAAPRTPKKAGIVRKRRADSARETLRALTTSDSLSAASGALSELGAKTLRTLVYEMKTRVGQRAVSTFYPAVRLLSENDLDWPNWLPEWSVQTLFGQAEERYAVPPGHYADQVLLLRATRGAGADMPHTERYEPADLGWGALLGETLTIEDVDAGHSSMLQEPFVLQTAALVRRRIAN